MGRPLARDARDTRRAILDAAVDLFADRGFHATSIRALAAAVGVRESALYHYFASKEAILDALFEERIKPGPELAAEYTAVVAHRPLVQLLTELCESLLKFVDDPVERKMLRVVTSLGAEAGHDQIPFRFAPAKRAF